MTGLDFESVLDRRISLIRNTLLQKAKEYATRDDRLNNFRRLAEMQRVSMARAAWGLVGKQIVSVQDMIESGDTFSREEWDEKIGDVINYMILIEAIVAEENRKQR